VLAKHQPVDPQSVPDALTQSPLLRSPKWPAYVYSSSARADSFRDWAQTLHGLEASSSVDHAKISPALLDHGADEAGTEGVVRRILAVRYQPAPESHGPSWLTVLGHAKDSLWSRDLFRCESAILRIHWVLVVMDQCPRRVVGVGAHRGVVDDMALCRMFNRATRGQIPPTYVSSDHDRLYRFHQWQRNLRICRGLYQTPTAA
jgi:hypothetical protein